MCHEFFDSFKGLIADVMLDAAGILRGDGFGNSEGDEKSRENLVAAINLLGNRFALLRQGEVSVTVYRNVSAAFEKSYCAGDAWLREAHMVAYVYGADVCLFFKQDVYRFKIHLAGLL